ARGEKIAEQRDVIDDAECDDLDLLATYGTGCAELSNRCRRVAQVENQDARALALADAPQCRVERRLEAQLVIQVQLAHDRLNALERGLILKDGDDAYALGLLRGRLLGNCGDCTHY